MVIKNPELQDEVRHVKNDMTGVVIAKFLFNDGQQYLDVRGVNNKIYYSTPMKNWVVTKVCDE